MIEKFASLVVDRSRAVVAVMLVLLAASAIMLPQVHVNTDLTKYLSDSSSMKIGIDLMNEQFETASVAKTVRVMYEGLPDDLKDAAYEHLASIEGVDEVEFERGSSDYERGSYTLYVIKTDHDYASAEERAIEAAAGEAFEGHVPVVKNDCPAKSEIPVTLLVAALALLAVVLFAMSASWVEPLLYLVTIGCAVLINMGTNLVQGSIAQVTFSIGAILQLVLSMDYSIILTNRYRQEVSAFSATGGDISSREARRSCMKRAIAGAFSSVAASSVTTCVGLLSLVFMTFKIGSDLGVVLAKGVVVSLLCVLTILPVLVLFFHDAIQRSAKPVPRPKLAWLARFEYKGRYALSVGFVALFIAAYFWQGSTAVSYTLDYEDPIADVFTPTTQVVVIYDNDDEKAAASIADDFANDTRVKDVMAYGTTIGKPLTAAELTDALEEQGGDGAALDPAVIDLVCQLYYDDDASDIQLTPAQVLSYVGELVENPAYADALDPEMAAHADDLQRFSDPAALTQPRDAAGLAEFLGMEQSQVEQVLAMRGTSGQGTTSTSVMDGFSSMFGGAGGSGGSGEQDSSDAAATSGSEDEMSVQEFLHYVNDEVLSSPMTSMMVGGDQAAQLKGACALVDAVVADEPLTSAQMAELFSGLGDTGGSVDAEQLDLVYLMYQGEHAQDDGRTLTLEQLADYLANDFAKDERFSGLLDEGALDRIDQLAQTVADARKQLVGPDFSIMAITLASGAGTDEAADVVEALAKRCDDSLAGEHHLIGDEAMVVEMSHGFGRDVLTVTLVSAVAIFLVVAISFRSLVVPAILVAVVQCGVYLTVVAIGIQGYSIYYLAMLIVQCILMGATIDYGILFVNNYRDARRELDVPQSLARAYANSISTVLTSGLIIILVTGVLARFASEPTIGQICQTISMGATSAVVLILAFLPALVATFDRFCRGRGSQVDAVEEQVLATGEDQ